MEREEECVMFSFHLPDDIVVRSFLFMICMIRTLVNMAHRCPFFVHTFISIGPWPIFICLYQ